MMCGQRWLSLTISEIDVWNARTFGMLAGRIRPGWRLDPQATSRSDIGGRGRSAFRMGSFDEP